MIHVELNISEKERDIVIKALEDYVSDLNMEIADTDQMDFRNNLKTKRTVLNKFIKELTESNLIPG